MSNSNSISLASFLARTNEPAKTFSTPVRNRSIKWADTVDGQQLSEVVFVSPLPASAYFLTPSPLQSISRLNSFHDSDEEGEYGTSESREGVSLYTPALSAGSDMLGSTMKFQFAVNDETNETEMYVRPAGSSGGMEDFLSSNPSDSGYVDFDDDLDDSDVRDRREDDSEPLTRGPLSTFSNSFRDSMRRSTDSIDTNAYNYNDEMGRSWESNVSGDERHAEDSVRQPLKILKSTTKANDSVLLGNKLSPHVFAHNKPSSTPDLSSKAMINSDKMAQISSSLNPSTSQSLLARARELHVVSEAGKPVKPAIVMATPSLPIVKRNSSLNDEDSYPYEHYSNVPQSTIPERKKPSKKVMATPASKTSKKISKADTVSQKTGSTPRKPLGSTTSINARPAASVSSLMASIKHTVPLPVEKEGVKVQIVEKVDGEKSEITSNSVGNSTVEVEKHNIPVPVPAAGFSNPKITPSATEFASTLERTLAMSALPINSPSKLSSPGYSTMTHHKPRSIPTLGGALGLLAPSSINSSSVPDEQNVSLRSSLSRPSYVSVSSHRIESPRSIAQRIIDRHSTSFSTNTNLSASQAGPNDSFASFASGTEDTNISLLKDRSVTSGGASVNTSSREQPPTFPNRNVNSTAVLLNSSNKIEGSGVSSANSSLDEHILSQAGAIAEAIISSTEQLVLDANVDISTTKKCSASIPRSKVPVKPLQPQPSGLLSPFSHFSGPSSFIVPTSDPKTSVMRLGGSIPTLISAPPPSRSEELPTLAASSTSINAAAALEGPTGSVVASNVLQDVEKSGNVAEKASLALQSLSGERVRVLDGMRGTVAQQLGVQPASLSESNAKLASNEEKLALIPILGDVTPKDTSIASIVPDVGMDVSDLDGAQTESTSGEIDVSSILPLVGDATSANIPLIQVDSTLTIAGGSGLSDSGVKSSEVERGTQKSLDDTTEFEEIERTLEANLSLTSNIDVDVDSDMNHHLDLDDSLNINEGEQDLPRQEQLPLPSTLAPIKLNGNNTSVPESESAVVSNRHPIPSASRLSQSLRPTSTPLPVPDFNTRPANETETFSSTQRTNSLQSLSRGSSSLQLSSTLPSKSRSHSAGSLSRSLNTSLNRSLETSLNRSASSIPPVSATLDGDRLNRSNLSMSFSSLNRSSKSRFLGAGEPSSNDVTSSLLRVENSRINAQIISPIKSKPSKTTTVVNPVIPPPVPATLTRPATSSNGKKSTTTTVRKPSTTVNTALVKPRTVPDSFVLPSERRAREKANREQAAAQAEAAAAGTTVSMTADPLANLTLQPPRAKPQFTISEEERRFGRLGRPNQGSINTAFSNSLLDHSLASNMTNIGQERNNNTIISNTLNSTLSRSLHIAAPPAVSSTAAVPVPFAVEMRSGTAYALVPIRDLESAVNGNYDTDTTKSTDEHFSLNNSLRSNFNLKEQLVQIQKENEDLLRRMKSDTTNYSNINKSKSSAAVSSQATLLAKSLTRSVFGSIDHNVQPMKVPSKSLENRPPFDNNVALKVQNSTMRSSRLGSSQSLRPNSASFMSTTQNRKK